MTDLEKMLKLLSSNNVIYNKKELRKYFIDNYSPALINIILKINNPIIYERFTGIMQYEVDISEIDEKRDSIIKRIILNNVNDEKDMLPFFEGITSDNYQDYWFTDNELNEIETGIKHNELTSVLNKISNKWLDEYIVYYFFHDNYYNFLINLNQLLRYIQNVKIDLVNEDHLSFYLECYNIPKKSFQEKIRFFRKNYQRNDIQSMFYDDMRTIKNHSYQNITSSLLRVNESIYNKDLSKKYDIPVYYLNGEKFNAIVRDILPNTNQSMEEYEKYVNSNRDRDYYSFSFISDKNIACLGNSTYGYTLLYSDINPRYITHVYHDDASSAFSTRQAYFVTDKINEIHTPSSLTGDTKYYNEIVIKKGKDGIKPSALACFDMITEDNIAFAKEHHLPIVLINSKKYHQNVGYTDYNNNDTYSI